VELTELHRILKGIATKYGFNENIEQPEHHRVDPERRWEVEEHYLNGDRWLDYIYEPGKDFEGYSHQSVYTFGGGEGEGEEYWKVFELLKDGEWVLYIRLNGLYNSWDSSQWDKRAEIVEKYEKVVTRWRSV